MNATGLNSATPGETNEGLLGRFDELLRRLDTIESVLGDLRGQRAVKDWYTVAEVAGLLGNAPFTVREWCRNRRVRAEKRRCGRGKHREWMISHAELTRIRNEGLLPAPEL